MRAIFIHVPRTSGNSIRAMFGAAVHNYGHTSARQMRDFMPEQWAKLWSFGFVRNPWDRTASLYYRTRYADKERRKTFRPDLDWQRADFTQWLKDGGYPDGHSWMKDFSPGNMLTDERADVLVSQVFCFEDLMAAYRTIAKRTGVKLPEELSHLKTSPIPKHPYRELIVRAEQKDMIADVGAWEIRQIGYKF